MLFNTLDYAKFFAAAFVVYWLLLRHKLARMVFLLAASYAFYAGWNWRYLPLILLSSTMDFWLASRIDREPDHSAERVVRGSGPAWLTIVHQGNLLEAKPADHAADEPVCLWHRVDQINGTARHEAEVAGIDRNLDVAQPS